MEFTDEFTNLRAQLEEEGAVVAEDEQDSGDGPSGARRLGEVAPRDQALDLMDVAGKATTRRLVPLMLVAATLRVLWLVLRRRDEDSE